MGTLDTSIKCTWIKRWLSETGGKDFPGGMIQVMRGVYSTDRIGKIGFNAQRLPIMGKILDKWVNFKEEFSYNGDNIRECTLFGNDGLNKDGMERVVFSRPRYEALGDEVNNIKIGELIDEGGHPVSLARVSELLGQNVTWAEYFRLRGCLTELLTRARNRVDGDRGIHMDEFLRSRSKGCRRYRDILIGKRSRQYWSTDPREIAAGRTLWGTGHGSMSRSLVELNYEFWKINSLSSDFKNFLFKMVHGKLYLNQVRAHFDNVLPGCTFCVLAEKKRLRDEAIAYDSQIGRDRLLQLPAENAKHIFWECMYSNSTITQFFSLLCGLDVRVDRWKYWCGINDFRESYVNMSLLLAGFIKFYLYRCRNKHVYPRAYDLHREWTAELESLQKYKKWVKCSTWAWDVVNAFVID